MFRHSHNHQLNLCVLSFLWLYSICSALCASICLMCTGACVCASVCTCACVDSTVWISPACFCTSSTWAMYYCCVGGSWLKTEGLEPCQTCFCFASSLRTPSCPSSSFSSSSSRSLPPGILLFKTRLMPDGDLVTLGSFLFVCASCAHRFSPVAGVQAPQTKRSIDCLGLGKAFELIELVLWLLPVDPR